MGDGSPRWRLPQHLISSSLHAAAAPHKQGDVMNEKKKIPHLSGT